MLLSMKATGMRRASFQPETLEWSQPVEEILTITSDVLRFDQWSVPISEVAGAVLNTEKILWKRQQSLALDCGDIKYLFSLWEEIADCCELPFAVQRIEKQMLLGKLIIFGATIFLANILFTIVSYVVGNLTS